jgi:hypothetical protein
MGGGTRRVGWLCSVGTHGHPVLCIYGAENGRERENEACAFE